MRKHISIVAALIIVTASVIASRMTHVEGQSRQDARFAAVPAEKGGQDVFGGYEVVANWPKPISSLPGHEKWTWGAGQSVFAESANRVFILQRGELPNIERPKQIKLPQLGPNIEFPIGRLPWRDATSTSPPGALETRDGKVGDDSDVGKAGEDFRWEHCIVVVDANGNMVEDWTQWDKMLRRPHAVYISPYDPEKRVWVVDDYRHAIFIFSNDGKRLLQTIGEPNVHAAAVGHPPVHHHERSPPLGRRPRHVEDPEIRSRRQLPVRVRNLGRFPGWDVGRARAERRPGRQLLRRGSRQRPRAEVSSASRRESCVPARPPGSADVIAEIG